jgi:arsenate reductase
MDILIIHNEACSKSRSGLPFLRLKGQEPKLRDYLTTPLTFDELKNLQKLLGLPARAMLRRGEKIFVERYAQLDEGDDEAVLKAIAEEPILLERPIVIRGQRAVIGRPTEILENLFSS